jgi:hypothetical protein
MCARIVFGGVGADLRPVAFFEQPHPLSSLFTNFVEKLFDKSLEGSGSRIFGGENADIRGLLHRVYLLSWSLRAKPIQIYQTVSGRKILGSSSSRSCISPPLSERRMAYFPARPV